MPWPRCIARSGCRTVAPVLDPWRRLAVARGNALVAPEWDLGALESPHGAAAPAVAVVRANDGRIRGLLPLVDCHSSSGSHLLSFPGTRFADIFHPVA